MAVVVTNGMTLLYDAETINGFSSVGQTSSNQLQPSIKIQGANSMEARISGTGILGWMFSIGAGTDLSNRFLYFWGFNNQLVDTLLNGGVRIRVSTDINGTSNYGEWFVSGSDVLVGTNSNFQNFAVHTARTPFDATLGIAPTLTNIGSVGVIFNNLTANGRISMWLDAARQGGLSNANTIKGGTVALPGKSNEVASNDKLITNAFGNFQLVKGAFIISSKLIFGDTAAVESNFADANISWFFEEQLTPPAGTVIYDLGFVGNAGVSNIFTLGSLVGSGVSAVGVGGGVVARATVNAPRFSITALDPNIIVSFLGTAISGADRIRLEQANASMISCNITDSDSVVIRNGSIFRKCILTSSAAPLTSAAIDLGAVDPPVDSVRDLTIIGASKGVLLKGVGDATFNIRNFQFAGNANDFRIDFALADTVTINLLEGTASDTPLLPANQDNVNGSTVVFNNSVPLSLKVFDTFGNSIPNVASYIEKMDGTILLNSSTDVLGQVSTSVNFSVDVPINIRLRKSSLATLLSSIQRESVTEVFTDFTAAAQNATANDVFYIKDTVASVGNHFYMGFISAPTAISVNDSTFGQGIGLVETVGVGGTVQWQYWNGATWANFTPTSPAATNNLLQNPDPSTVNIPNLPGLTQRSVNGSGSLNFVRIEVLTNYSTLPLGRQIRDGFVLPNAASRGDISVAPVDITATINNPLVSDNLIDSTSAIGSSISFGKGTPFRELILNISTAGVGGSIVWEYFNGAVWSSLTPMDNTNGFSVLGINTLEFTAPADWTQTTINGVGPAYYVRARVLSNYSVLPQASAVTADFKRYTPISTTGTISTIGFSLDVTMSLDSIAQSS